MALARSLPAALLVGLLFLAAAPATAAPDPGCGDPKPSLTGAPCTSSINSTVDGAGELADGLICGETTDPGLRLDGDECVKPIDIVTGT